MRRTAHLLCAIMLGMLVPACGLLLEKGREVVAEVNGEPIRLSDFQAYVRNLNFEERAQANDSDPKVSTQKRRSILRQMVADRIMVLEAENRGITVSDEEVEQELGSLPPVEEVEETTEERAEETHEGMHRHEEQKHPEWEIEEARNRLLIKKLEGQEVSEKALSDYYLAHFRKDYMIDPPIISYEIVAVAPENKDIVDELYKLCTEKGLFLTDAYVALGSPRNVLQAGLSPPMPLNMLIPPMQEKIKDMKRNDVSKPFYLSIDGKDQYIIFKLVRKMTRRPFGLVKDELRQKLLLQLIVELQEKYGVKYYFDKLNYRVGD